MRAVIYCRVSTKEQTKNLSLPTQRSACQGFCKREGYTVDKVFIEEGESAKTADRPEKEMVSYCRLNKGRLDAVVVYNVSRFSRQAHDHMTLRALLRSYGVTLRSVTETFDDSPAGKFMEAILASVGQFDNDSKAERTRTGMAAALERGRWTFQAPLGYLNGPRNGPSLIPDPERSELLKQGFEEYAGGTKTVKAVLEMMTRRGLRTRKGLKLSPQSLHALLRNPVYIGRLEVPKWTISRPGDFEPLVSENVFRKIQDRLAGKTSFVTSHDMNRPDFPLRRFLRCGDCDTPLTASWSKGRGGRYGYYHCRKCPAVSIRKEAIELLFLRTLEGLQPRPEYTRLFNAVVRDAWQKRQKSAREVRKKLDQRVQSLQQKLDQLDEIFIFQKGVDGITYKRQRDRLREDMTLAELELQHAKSEELDIEGILAFAEKVLSNAARLWSESSLEQRQHLQKVFFPKGLVWKGGNFGTPVTCLAFNYLPPPESEKSNLVSPAGFEPALPA